MRAIDSNNARRARRGLINTEIRSGSRIGNYCTESRVRLIPGKPRFPLVVAREGEIEKERERDRKREREEEKG